MKRITVLVLSVLTAITVEAQQRPTLALTDRPHRPIDTVATYRSDARVVLYSDNTFKVIPTHADEWARTTTYRTHWDTVNLFAYRGIEVANLPQTIDLHLIDDLDGYHCPSHGKILSPYGPRGRRNHNGIDISLKQGDPVYAAFSGRVRYAKYNAGGFGNLVILRHPSGLETYYGHLSRCNVKAGDWVVAGQVIGYGGQTGRASGTHLHFECRYCDQTFDPQRLIDFSTGNLRYQTFALERSFFNIHSRSTDGLEDDENLIDPQSLIAKADSDSISASIIATAEQKPTVKEPEKAPEKTTTASKTTTKSSTSGARYHTIRSGDTLYSIARNNSTTVQALCKLNGISARSTIRPGHKIRVK